MRSRKRKKSIAAIVTVILIIVLLVPLSIFAYKFFTKDSDMLDYHTLLLLIVSKDAENIENVTNIFLIDFSEGSEIDKSQKIQIISIPTDLECDAPGVSVKKIGELYPFGGGKLLAETIANKIDIPVDKYMTINEKYLENILKDIKSIQLNFQDSIDFEGYIFQKGENTVNLQELIFLLNHTYTEAYLDAALNNRLYILAEVFKSIKDKKINFFDLNYNNDLSTNIEEENIPKINSYFNNQSSQIFLNYLTKELTSDEINNLISIILDNNYKGREFSAIKKFYDDIIAEPVLEKATETTVDVITEESLAEETTAVEETSVEEIANDKISIEVLNGNNIGGSATITVQKLIQQGYSNIVAGNVTGATIYENTLIYFKTDFESQANEIAAILKINKEFIDKVQNEAEAKTDIQIIVGMDYSKQE